MAMAMDLNRGVKVYDRRREQHYGKTTGEVLGPVGPYRTNVQWSDDRGMQLEKNEDLVLVTDEEALSVRGYPSAHAGNGPDPLVITFWVTVHPDLAKADSVEHLADTIRDHILSYQSRDFEDRSILAVADSEFGTKPEGAPDV